MYGNWKGIQHSKSFGVTFRDWKSPFKSRTFFILGSSNWTLSSRCNCEMSVFLDMTDLEGEANEVEARFEMYMNKGQPFNADKATASMRARSASVGPTQRRFNAARQGQQGSGSSAPAG